jgi:hypothetical protein
MASEQFLSQPVVFLQVSLPARQRRVLPTRNRCCIGRRNHVLQLQRDVLRHRHQGRLHLPNGMALLPHSVNGPFLADGVACPAS